MHACAVRIETVEGRERLLEIIDEWSDLAAAAGVPNIFFEPMAILPALDFPTPQGLFFALAWGAGAAGCRKLIGLLPLTRWERKPGILLPRGLESWDYRLRAFGEPLVRAGHERAFWSALLSFLDSYRGASFVRLTQLHEASASTRALREIAEQSARPLYVTRRLERAMLRGPTAREDYLETLSKKGLANFKRRRNRLAELGAVTTERLERGGDAAAWFDEFIGMEARGWKGRRGVAAASEPFMDSFTRRLLSQAHASGRLDMRRMQVGGKTISMIAYIETGRTAISFKITYDEAYARYSPGVLLHLDYLDHGLGLDWVDSCATPGHPMYERIWTGRLPLATFMIPFDRPRARMACSVEQAIRIAGSRLPSRPPGRKEGLRAASS
ncbi:MAG TPA: GNAT family N-acetyltransferase [Allosphingosinicella sp.]|nr:GNAT family N-acetyltransferase [Allosphingosinicella sp.]